MDNTEHTSPRELPALVQLVAEMRTAQKNYFRTRSRKALEDSKTLERSVDKEIEKYHRPELF